MNETIDEKTNEKVREELLRQTAEFITGVTTMAERKGITHEELEAVYNVGRTYYTTGNIGEAEKVFEFLCLMQHTDPKYQIALGAVRQLKKEFPAAIRNYACAMMLDMHQPKPHFHAAECYLALGDLDNAESGALSLLDCCPAGAGKNDIYRAKAEKLLALVKNAREAGKVA